MYYNVKYLLSISINNIIVDICAAINNNNKTPKSVVEVTQIKWRDVYNFLILV